MTSPEMKQFNVMLPPKLYSKLRERCNHEGVSAGAIIRKLCVNYLAMVSQSFPTCADGQRCFVPQMHANTKPPTKQQNGASD